MKIRYPVIAIIISFSALIILRDIGNPWVYEKLCDLVLLLLIPVCLLLILYLLLRNLFRAIKGLVTKKVMVEPEADILRSEIERLSKRVEELEKDH